jgi:ribonuclease-3
MNPEVLSFIQKSIDYKFENTDLLDQAFTRRSYSAEHGGIDNEVLEFIGDKALDLVVVKYLAEEYGDFETPTNFTTNNRSGRYFCRYNEGKLTALKSKLVQQKTLASQIDFLGFAEYMHLGNGDQKKKANELSSVKEDLFEAIIGAVALDSEWNLNAIERVVFKMLSPDTAIVEESNDNHIEIIEKWARSESGSPPVYHVSENNSKGYMVSIFHYPPNCTATEDFVCQIILPNVEETIYGYGNNTKDARKSAALSAYIYLKKNNKLHTMRDEIENPNRADAINQLEILARRGHFSIPTYTFEESQDIGGNHIWDCTCEIEEINYLISGSSTTKKDAKKDAAYNMLLSLLGEN